MQSEAFGRDARPARLLGDTGVPIVGQGAGWRNTTFGLTFGAGGARQYAHSSRAGVQRTATAARSGECMDSKPVFRVGAAGLDPRDWRLIEIVFKHSQYNKFEFRLIDQIWPLIRSTC
jgi:hypothetical protein